MPIDYPALIKTLTERFGEAVLGSVDFRNQTTIRIKATANLQVLRFLRDDPSTKFDMLTDVTCVDSLRLPEDMLAEYPERFAVVYQLTSLEHGARLRVKAYVPEEPC